MAQVAEVDWIKWKGGDRPVPPETMVRVRFACDHSEASALSYPPRPARWWDHAWNRKRGDNRIIAYVVVSA